MKTSALLAAAALALVVGSTAANAATDPVTSFFSSLFTPPAPQAPANLGQGSGNAGAIGC